MQISNAERKRLQSAAVIAFIIGLFAAGAAFAIYSNAARPPVSQALAAFGCVAGGVFVLVGLVPLLSRSRTRVDRDA